MENISAVTVHYVFRLDVLNFYHTFSRMLTAVVDYHRVLNIETNDSAKGGYFPCTTALLCRNNNLNVVVSDNNVSFFFLFTGLGRD